MPAGDFHQKTSKPSEDFDFACRLIRRLTILCIFETYAEDQFDEKNNHTEEVSHHNRIGPSPIAIFNLRKKSSRVKDRKKYPATSTAASKMSRIYARMSKIYRYIRISDRT